MLEIGEIAPDFHAESTEGPIHLYDYAGKKNVVLFFYPINNTPGCRMQLCAARDAMSDYEAHDAVVFGVNPGKFAGHQKFTTKHEFGFPLIYDENWRIANGFKILTLAGLMQARTVYVLDKTMTVRYVYRGMPSTEELLHILDGIAKQPVIDNL